MKTFAKSNNALSLTRQSSLLAMSLLIVIVAVGATLSALGSATSHLWERCAAAILLIAAGIVTNRLAVSIGFFNDYCTLPLSLYAIVACGTNPAMHLVEGGAVALMMAIALHSFIRTLHHANDKELPLFGGILLGAMPLIYPPAIAFAPLMVAWAWVVPLNPRQAIASWVGYLLPVAAASYAVWYAGEPISTVVNGIFDDVMVASHAFTPNALSIATAAMAIAVVLLSLAGALLLYARRNALLSRSRKGVMMTFLTLVATIAAGAIPAAESSLGAVAATPAAVLVAALLNHCNRRTADAIYLLLIAMMIGAMVIGG